MKKTNNLSKIIIGSMLFLGCISLYIATRASLFYRNMTFVGNMPAYRLLFITWGIMQSIFFTSMAFMICDRYFVNTEKQNVKIFILVDTALNIIAYLLPYKHPGGDLLSQLHVYLSFISSALAVCILLYILKRLAFIHPGNFIVCRNQIFTLLMIISFLAMLLGDFTGIMEIVYLNGISIIMYTMLFKT